MNKTRLLPLILLVFMAITAIAFAGCTAPEQEDPAPTYIGQILSVMEDGNLLTEGVYGIEGLVIVTLPENPNQSVDFVEGFYLTASYDGSIAEDCVMQIWATAVKSVTAEMPAEAK